jgi:hypothetical protein
VNLAAAADRGGEFPEDPTLKENVDSTEEVDSPAKELPADRDTIQSDVTNNATVLNTMDNNASMLQCGNLGISIYWLMTSFFSWTTFFVSVATTSLSLLFMLLLSLNRGQGEP